VGESLKGDRKKVEHLISGQPEFFFTGLRLGNYIELKQVGYSLPLHDWSRKNLSPKVDEGTRVGVLPYRLKGGGNNFNFYTWSVIKVGRREWNEAKKKKWLTASARKREFQKKKQD